MEAGSIRQRKRCFPNNLDPSRRICFPILCTNRLSREQSANGESNFTFTPAWQTQSWYPLMLQLTLEVPLLLPIILGLNGEKHSLIEKGNLQLLVWAVSGKDYMQKERLCHSYHKCHRIRYKFPLQIGLV